jgi:hypothetical protein
MSTKNLSRTIIEGGRARGNKSARYHSNATERATLRAFCYAAEHGAADDLVVPKRSKVRKDFADKLGPIYRWLRTHIGKPWNDVHSKLLQSFDTRTTAGRHVIFDHVLRSVDHLHEEANRGYYDFYVDEAGLLRLSERNRWQRKSWRDPNAVKTAELVAWVQGRKVMDYGVSMFWMVPTAFEWRECGKRLRHSNGFWYGSCERTEHRTSTKRVLADVTKLLAFEKKMLYQEPDGVGGVLYYRDQPTSTCRQAVGHYRQGARLTAEDLVLWNRLNVPQRDALLWVKAFGKN